MVNIWTVPKVLLGSLFVAMIGCQAMRSPDYLDLSSIQRLDIDLERARWKPVAAEMRHNIYLPEAWQEQISEDDKRKLIADFYRFRNQRAAVLEGRASIEERRTYYSTYARNLAQRRVILQHLISTLERETSSAAAAARARLVAREQTARRELEYVERMHSSIEDLLRSTRDTDKRKISQGRRIICVVTAHGMVYCVTELMLAEDYMEGHWTRDVRWVTDRFDPARAYDFIYRLEKISELLELDPTHNTLIACANLINVVWYSQNTERPQVTTASGSVDANFPSVGEMAGFRAGCGMLARTRSTGERSKAFNPNWVESTIEALDAEFSECWESRLPLPTFIHVGQGVITALDLIRIHADKLIRLVGIFAVKQVIQNTPHERADPRTEQEIAAAQAAAEAESAEIEARFAEFEAETAQLELEAVEKEFDEVVNNPNSTSDEIVEASRRFTEAKQKAEAAKKAAEDKKANAQAAKKEAEQTEAQLGGSAVPDSGSQVVDGDYSTCEGRQLAWEFFKKQCEIEGGWDRPGHRCNELLRRKIGCVSSWLINPNPEGSGTCQRASIDMDQLLEEACKERQGIMSAAEPIEHFVVNCSGFGQFSRKPDFPDICSDPAARPQEGQCDGLTVVQDDGQPSPGSVPTVLSEDGVTVFDGLMLEGLGLRGTLEH